jgi:hypothetical protein
LKRINIPLFLLIISLFFACTTATTQTGPGIQTAVSFTPTLDEGDSQLGLTAAQIDTLLSLEIVDDYPLYTLRYEGSYPDIAALGYSISPEKAFSWDLLWGCSLFAALGDPEHILFGRNFDWGYSPALLLFTDPPSGYASASMVDIAFLGYSDEEAAKLAESPVEARLPLLQSPSLPFDGFNEKGLVVGMAAVPGTNPIPDYSYPTLGSLEVIRLLLDHAANVDEAVTLMGQYHIDFGNGPTIHYLITDTSGRAALVEYYHSKMYVSYNQQPWHLATNFILETAGEKPEGRCKRYDILHDRLMETRGILDAIGAMQLLQEGSEDHTQWSIVYNPSHGEIQVVMGRDFEVVYEFHLD